MDVSFTTDRSTFVAASPARTAGVATAGNSGRMPFSDSVGFLGLGLDDSVCSHDDSFMRFVNSPTNAALTLPAPLTFDDDEDDEDSNQGGRQGAAADISGMDWELGASVAFRPSPSEPARCPPAGQRLASELPRLPSAPPPAPPTSSLSRSKNRLSCKRPSPTVAMSTSSSAADFIDDFEENDDDNNDENRCQTMTGKQASSGTPKRRRLARPLGDLTNSTTPTFKKPPPAFAKPLAALHRCTSELACGSANANADHHGNKPNRPVMHRQESVATCTVLDSARVDRAIASIDSLNLIGNSEQRHALPTVKELDYGIRHVTGDTVSRLVNGQFAGTVSSYAIIDCRYPYEFSGGHIQGAVNVYTHEDLLRRFLEPASRPSGSPQASVLIFHCEFSSERAPKLARFLRQRDREANACNYPDLYYPEVYVLQGGYKAFYEAFKSDCQPANYVKMLDQNYKTELAHFERIGRAWERQNSRSRHSQLERLVAASGKVLF